MITEELGVHLRTSLGPLIGVHGVSTITPDEYADRENPPDWFDNTAEPPEMVLYIELAIEPQKHIVKHINDIVHHSRTQAHYIKERDGSDHVYICPTTNNFSTLYNLAPANPQHLFQ